MVGSGSNPLSKQDRALLDSWAQEYSVPLKTYFMRRATSPGEAEELAQEVFVRLANRADLASIEIIKGYIFTAARTVLSEHRRKLARRHNHLHTPYVEERHGVADISPETLLSDRQMLALVLEGLQELPEKTRNIFVLYHFEGVKQMAISNTLRIGLRTVERHLAKANTHLLEKLGRDR